MFGTGARVGLWIALAILAATWTSESRAGDDRRKIDETITARAEGTVSISNVMGSVEVVGWSRNEVHITGYLSEIARELVIESEDEYIEIEVDLPRSIRGHHKGSDLLVRVPENSNLEVETVSASVEIEGVEGELQVETVSGATRILGPADWTEVESVSGSVDLEEIANEVEVESVSGSIRVHECESADVSTTSGSIEIVARELQGLDAASVSGRIEVDAGSTDESRWEIENFSGSVDVYLSSDVDATIDVETFSGSIDSDFGGRVRREDRYGPGNSLYYVIGDGGAQINVGTFSGSVEIVSRKK